MTSVVAICNLALTVHLGKKNISDLDEGSAEARACKQLYDHTLSLMLQSYPWRFAGKTASLAQVTNDKVGEWAYAYSRPNDCLKLRWIRPEYKVSSATPLGREAEIEFPYELEGDTIYCDLSPAFARYTRPISDPSKFPPLFVEALAASLAVRLCMPLTKDSKLRNETFQLSLRAIGEAQMADANEQRETSDHTSEFVEGR